MSDIFTAPTAQSLFDHVVVALALQGKRSTTTALAGEMTDGSKAYVEMCTYRGKGGTKCGVGFLLTDDEAAAIGNSVGIGTADHVPVRLQSFAPLLIGLQQAHDRASAKVEDQTFIMSGDCSIKALLKGVTDDFKLSDAVLLAAFPDGTAPEFEKEHPAPIVEKSVVDLTRLAG